jgi:hypothetical protein
MNVKIGFLLCTTLSLVACNIQKETTRMKDNHGSIEIQSTLLGGDQSEVSGTVRDATSGEALPFANIIFVNDQGGYHGVQSDLDGLFTIPNLPLGMYTIRISLIGYNELIFPVDLQISSRYTIDISLYNAPVYIEKPVIYLYPTQTQSIHVALDYKGQLLHSYPTYPASGWTLSAAPNGTLWDENGTEYYALFWEGLPDETIIPTEGFVVPGKATAAFLEEKLELLGLNRREANEFIMYWLPRLENNPYNLIHFASTDYEEQAVLTITPQPETIIRVMMLTQPLETDIQFPVQDITNLQKTRKGFTVVEWGGSVVRFAPTNL